MAIKRRKEMRYMYLGVQDGFSGTTEIADMSIANADTQLLLDEDTHALHDDVTIVPVGARFTLPADTNVRTVTAVNANAQASVTIGMDTTGTYTVSVNGVATAAIAGTDNAAAIQAAIELLANVESGDVSVTGTGPFTIEMTGQYAGVAVALAATPTGLDNFAFSQTHDGGKTWRITFAPALTTVGLPSDGDEITWLPQRIIARVGDGEFQWTETDAPTFDKDRGLLDNVRLGDETEMDVSLTAVLDWLVASSGNPTTIYEALHRINGAAGWHSTAEDPCEPYCIDVFYIDQPPCNSEPAEYGVFPRFYKTSLNPTVSDAQINIEGKCKATRPTITRVSNPSLV